MAMSATTLGLTLSRADCSSGIGKLVYTAERRDPPSGEEPDCPRDARYLRAEAFEMRLQLGAEALEVFVLRERPRGSLTKPLARFRVVVQLSQAAK